MQPRHTDGFSIILLVVVLFTLAALGTTGWFGWHVYRQSTQPRAHLTGAKVKPDLIAFTHTQLPNTYALITALDDTIVLVNGEIDRLAGIAKQYPAQNPLLHKEIEKLETIKAELSQALTKTLADTETLYVTHLMDPAKGLRAIKKQRTILRRPAKAVLRQHAALRHRLSQSQSQGFLEKLLALVGK